MGFLDFISSAWEWVKSAIQKVWERFKVFLVEVADYAKTVIGTLRELVQRAMKGISNLYEKVKAGWKKFYLIFTKKNNSFKTIIEDAQNKGKMGKANVDGNDIFQSLNYDIPRQPSNYDIHIVQTDANHNTENVYSVSPEQLSEDMRNKVAATDVHEIKFNF